MLRLRCVGDPLRPAAVGVEAVELVELVAVVVGLEEDRPVAADRDASHRVVGERRQLRRLATRDRGRPEVELPRAV